MTWQEPDDRGWRHGDAEPAGAPAATSPPPAWAPPDQGPPPAPPPPYPGPGSPPPYASPGSAPQPPPPPYGWNPPPPPGQWSPPAGQSWPQAGQSWPQAGQSWPQAGQSWPQAGPAPAPYPALGFQTSRPGVRPRTVIALAVGMVLVVALIVGLLGTSRSPAKPVSPGSAVATPSAPGAAGAPTGYQTFSDQADHFSIAVPSSWRSVDPASPGATAAFEQLQQTNPNFKRAFGGNIASLLANDVKFLAVDPVSQATEAPNINVIVKPAPGFVDADLGQIRSALPGEYTKLGATLLGITTVTLDGHQALKTSANLPINTDVGTTVVASQTQYILGANDFIYIITLTGTSPDLSTIPTTLQIS